MSPVVGAAAVNGAAALASPFQFWVCIMGAAIVGLCMAFLDKTDSKGGNGSAPISHLQECADSADLLFSDLFADGAGLGVLEPLWRLFTPDGALWTLLTGWSPRDHASSLGLNGILAAIASLFTAGLTLLSHGVDAFGRLIRPKKKGVSKDDGPSSAAHEKIKMTFAVELHAYWGYLRLFCMGIAREYIVRALALVWRDDVSRRYVTRERWSTGWVDFYLQHMYKLYVDCFARPICGAPDACVEVVIRKRPGGNLFGPLYDFSCTSEKRTCVNLSSYNYLGFGGVDEFCTPVARKAAMELGWSTSGTRTEGGTQDIHRQLEDEVAAYLGKEDALVLGMGFATNSTILPALFEAKAGGQGMLVLSDELNHRSIVEGVRLSGATVRAFTHNHMPALEKELKRAVEDGQPGTGKPWRKIFVVVEGIYSMEGDFCRLREIVTLKNRYGAYLYLDEAHSIGAVGSTGRGVTELLGVPTSEVEVMMGTFTKSFGSAGGYVAASKEVIAALRRSAPGSVFAGGMAPPCAAQALQALRVISGKEGGKTGAKKLASIRDNANFFRTELDRLGFKVLGDVDSPIVPVMLHHPWKMAAFSRKCFDRGIAVVVVGNPAVPVLYERVRFCISAAHTREQLTKAIKEIHEVGKEIGVLYELQTDKAELEAREKQDQEYARWLRSAPLELRSESKPVVSWRPEPLAPPVALSGSLSELLEQACAKPQEGRASALDFRLFDPLSFAAKPLKPAQDATNRTMDVYGFGACGPRGFYGTSMPHLDLEASIAKFLGVDASIMYSAGVTTASSVIPALVQSGDRVIVDSEVHLGIRTGLRLCKCEVKWVPHNDAKEVERALQSFQQSEGGSSSSKPKTSRRTFIVTEALCQRTGNLAPLTELVALKEKFGALLVLDETMTFGVYGNEGRGLCEHFGVPTTKVDALLGSLEHAVAGVGGFCAGRKGLVDHQRLAGSGYCFSASCPPCACSAAQATVENLPSPDSIDRRARLKANAAKLNEVLNAVAKEVGNDVLLLGCPESYVQHLRWRTANSGGASSIEANLVRASQRCRDSGVQVQVCSPDLCGAEGSFSSRLGAPPAPMPSLRLAVTSEHTLDDIVSAGKALKEALLMQ
jgi:serine palmitoyltransferase